ncbi:hypothetical protein JQ581_34735 [Bradyrhizobium liaoningense]|uniref:hypothetical protein n=1 Tax=Bradyrhizobium liaoningense TaxID=43992 RepID=UPI001BAAEF68|nr:hypothetical protein [Bradyrhizobium liaoningense]MBR0742106.1 hypothetical protein [Bradyrhizobium liaoningense]
MNEISKREPTGVAAYGERDPFEVYADSIRPGYIVGKLLKFSKGDYLLGESAGPVDLGTVVTAAIDQLLTGWTRWEHAKPAEHRMVLVASGEVPPLRGVLGHLDRADWEVDKDGKPRDPWQYSAYLPLLSTAGELWTFSTSSRGGHGAIGRLSRAYAHHRRQKPKELPLIGLKCDSYPHSDRQIGRIKVPLFELAGWEAADRVAAALAEIGLTPDVEPPIAKDRSGDMDDDIPF